MGERLFCYIFALYMLIDFMVVKLDFILILHHIFCLVGHAIICVYEPEGFMQYFAGVVALELGSGCMNQYCVYPNSALGAPLYVVGMSVSNLAGLYSAYQWSLLPASFSTKAFNIITIVVIVFMRQKSCYKYIRKGPYARH